MKLESEITWSLVSDKPIILHYSELNEYLVIWAGIPMPLQAAIAVVFTEVTSMHPSSKAGNVMIRNLKKFMDKGIIERDYIPGNVQQDFKELEKACKEMTIDVESLGRLDLNNIYAQYSMFLRSRLRETFIKLKNSGYSLKELLSLLSTKYASEKDL